jgi:O-antigen/teichoic acid export membrane protein
MGIIQKQGISNSILIIIGAAIGAFNVLFMYPLILPKEYFGLTNVLVHVSYIASQFALLGTHVSIIKFWNTLKNNYILFKYLFRNSIIFSIAVILVLILWKPNIIQEYQETVSLFTENYNYIFLLLFFDITLQFFTAVSHANLKTSFPIFLKNIVLRIYQSFLLVMYYYTLIDLDMFLLLFVVGYGLEAGIVLYYAISQKSLSKPLIDIEIPKEQKKEIFKFSTVNFLTGFSGSIVARLDVLMIGALLISSGVENFSLKAVAVYTVALYITNIIMMPARGLFSISTPIIAKLWNENNVAEIEMIYKKASINLTIIAVLIFSLIMINLDDMLFFIPKYSEAKGVVLILGVAQVINMCLGVNNIIIGASKYYKVLMYTMVMLILIAFGFNYILIPEYGIEGAAIGSLISVFTFNVVTFLFLYFKFDLQPFSIKTLIVLGLGLIIYYLTSFINFNMEIVNIIVKSMILSVTYLLIIYKMKISTDANDIVNKFLSKIKLN